MFAFGCDRHFKISRPCAIAICCEVCGYCNLGEQYLYVSLLRHEAGAFYLDICSYRTHGIFGAGNLYPRLYCEVSVGIADFLARALSITDSDFVLATGTFRYVKRCSNKCPFIGRWPSVQVYLGSIYMLPFAIVYFVINIDGLSPVATESSKDSYFISYIARIGAE